MVSFGPDPCMAKDKRRIEAQDTFGRKLAHITDIRFVAQRFGE